MLAEWNRYDPKMKTREWIARTIERAPLREAPLTFAVAERGEALLALGDPADTLIAATALTYNLTLVTVDRRLRSIKGLRTVSR